MRRTTAHRGWLAAAGGALLLAAALTACGNDSQCNHVIQDVARFEDCQAIAVERDCSAQVTYSNKNNRCKVIDCGDCHGATPTPTAEPTVVPSATPQG
jgi:hypothetical protein